MIRNKSGKIIGSYEVGPFEIGQDLVLECEVKGGKYKLCQQILIE